nr:hypothetical protein [Helicobacter pylori]
MIEARNHADSLAHQTQKSLDEHKANLNLSLFLSFHMFFSGLLMTDCFKFFVFELSFLGDFNEKSFFF